MSTSHDFQLGIFYPDQLDVLNRVVEKVCRCGMVSRKKAWMPMISPDMPSRFTVPALPMKMHCSKGFDGCL
ncbi:hypothetical protein G6N74_28760 [Mesorhizobium sp. CGMCC 1.15528]|uniref:Uncharacterized protein n=1 Tax=Mesorhizobium zhangyense TaxID=1776730 RepID=A0A7C9VHC9_9HYPH|nr:hypothetical protein [Mesorhizobium zhangyense]NGN45052.1 hypothetical protein [Mesorhizobium zhangyense]